MAKPEGILWARNRALGTSKVALLAQGSIPERAGLNAGLVTDQGCQVQDQGHQMSSQTFL